MKKDIRLIVIITFQIVVGIAIIIFLKTERTEGLSPEAIRNTSAKLESAGLLDEAINGYENYFEKGTLNSKEKSKIAFSLGGLNEKTGHYEKAIKWYYNVETLDPNSPNKEEAGKAIVALLEKLQKFSAANMVLSEKTALNPKQGGKVVAKIGAKELYDYELSEYTDSIPQKAGDKKSQQMLQAFVADRIVFEHAVKMGFDKDPELRKRLAQIEKQLIIAKVYETEIQSKIRTDESDIENYYKTNKDRYKKPYKDIKDTVKQEYTMEKAKILYQELVQEKIKSEQVELFPENIK